MNISDLPRNMNARRDIFRKARLGTRPAAQPIKVEDGFAVVEGTGALITSFNAQTTTIDFFRVLKAAWTSACA